MEIQCRFPLCTRPYERLAKRMNLKETSVLKKVGYYEKRGIIRRIGPLYNARAIGLTTTLVALSVPTAKIRRAAACINSFREVTHNYLRRHPLNIWFTLAAADARSKKKIIRTIKKLISPRLCLELPPLRVFKLAALFNPDIHGDSARESAMLREKERAQSIAHARRPTAFSQRHGPCLPSGEAGTLPVFRGGRDHGRYPHGIRRIPLDLPIVSSPFTPGTLAVVRHLLRAGAIRRFGAVLDPASIGYRFSALIAWKINPSRRGAVGRRFASFPQVSHCYERKTPRSWPYALYTMIHEISRERGRVLIDEMAHVAGGGDYVVFETVRRLARPSFNVACFAARPRPETANNSKITMNIVHPPCAGGDPPDRARG